MTRVVWPVLALAVGCGGAAPEVQFGSSEAALEAAPEDLGSAQPVAGAPGGSIVLEALLEPASTVQLRFEVPGKVESVFVAAGDRIRKGQALASLDVSERKARLDDARRRWHQHAAALPPGAVRSGEPSDELKAEMEDRLASIREAAQRSPGDLAAVKAAVEAEGQKGAADRAIAIARRRDQKPSTAAIRRSHQNSMSLALHDELGQRVAQLQGSIQASTLYAPADAVVAAVHIVPGSEWNSRGEQPAIELVDDSAFHLRASLDSPRALLLRGDEPIWCELSGAGGTRVTACSVSRVSDVEHRDTTEGVTRRLREVTFLLRDVDAGGAQIGDPARIAIAP